MTLTISNARGALIGDAEATGSIHNSDPVPQAWLARFTKTAGVQALDALTQRFAHRGDDSLGIAGYELLGGDPGWQPTHEREGRTEWENGETLTLHDVLNASRFHLSAKDGEQGREGTWTVWGSGAKGGFEAKEGDAQIDGQVESVTVGADIEMGALTAGMMLQHANGEGRHERSSDDLTVTLESTLNTVYPYARLETDPSNAYWAGIGIGSGEVTLTGDGLETMRTDTATRTAVLGSEHTLARFAESGTEVRLDTRALWIRTESDAVKGLTSTRSTVRQLRARLSGERVYETEAGAQITPQLSLGATREWGDADEGTSLDAGAGVSYHAGRLSLAVHGKHSIAHSARGHRQWNAGANIALAHRDNGTGLALRIGPSWDGDGHSIEGEAGYGFALNDNRGVVTLYNALRSGERSNVRNGVRWRWSGDASVETELESAQAQADKVSVRVRLRW